MVPRSGIGPVRARHRHEDFQSPTNGLLVHGPPADISDKRLKSNEKSGGPGGLNRAAQVADQWIMSQSY